MDIVDKATAQEPLAREMTRVEIIRSKVRNWLHRQRRRLPHLVWHGDEVDVRVCLSTDKLTASTTDEAMRQLYSGAFFEIERIFLDMGIGFDTGMGGNGRDWEWDWSLKGPISVQFRSRAKKPERRMERPRPKLVVSNNPRSATED